MRTCFFVLTRRLTQFDGYVGNRAIAMHMPQDKRESVSNWHAQIRQIIQHWNVLKLDAPHARE
jgi:hypothetical protein